MASEKKRFKIAKVYVICETKKGDQTKKSADSAPAVQNASSNGESLAYIILDKLERVARVIAAISRAIQGKPDPDDKKTKKKQKKKQKEEKKFFKKDKKTGQLFYKKAPKVKKIKKEKPLKRV